MSPRFEKRRFLGRLHTDPAVAPHDQVEAGHAAVRGDADAHGGPNSVEKYRVPRTLRAPRMSLNTSMTEVYTNVRSREGKPNEKYVIPYVR